MKWFFLILFITACHSSSPEGHLDFIAKVNGSLIPKKAFLSSLEQLQLDQDEASKNNPKISEQTKSRALNEVILSAILHQEASKREVKVAKEEVEARLTNWKEGYPKGGFEEVLKKRKQTELQLRTQIEEQLTTEKIVEALFSHETRVSDEEIQSYYSSHTSEMNLPERIHAFQIVVPRLEEAEKIRHDLLSGTATFESLAREHSMSPDSAQGGDLGFFARNEKIAAFNEAFKLSVGGISKPIHSEFGFHLLKVVEKHPGRKLPLLEAKERIAGRLKRSKEQKIFKDWLTKILKDSEIYRNDALYGKI